jgi:hypothetical protein
VQGSWCFIFFSVALFLRPYYGSLGVTLENSKLVPTVHFPWDYLEAAPRGRSPRRRGCHLSSPAEGDAPPLHGRPGVNPGVRPGDR